MDKRDELYKLSDTVEFDEGYFETEVPIGIKSKLKRGKGSQCQNNVAVMSESVPLENIETGEVSSQCRYFKMKVLESHKSESGQSEIKESIDAKTIVFTDKGTNYVNIELHIEAHISFIQAKRLQ